MGPLIALLIIATVSLLIVRIGSTALMMTGLSWDAASFQAYSAFFGVGFTTKEAELVVNHPLRRRIIRDLILAGNVGLTSALATVVVTFVQQGSAAETISTILLLVGGAVGLIILSKIGILKKGIDWSIHRGLEKTGVLHVLDYDLLLRVQAGYCISEVDIAEDHPFAGRPLGESRPADHGIIVLGITRPDGTFVGTPSRHEIVSPGDTLLIYGTEEHIKPLWKG